MTTTDTTPRRVFGEAAGVPYVALPPAGVREGPPLVVGWHMVDPPRSEAAMAAALPLAAAALRDTLRRRYADPDQVSLVSMPEMAHALAEAPGIEPAPQTRDAERVDAEVTAWFRRHLRR